MTQENTYLHSDCYGCMIHQACATAQQAGLSEQETRLLLNQTLRWILDAQPHTRVQHLVRQMADFVLQLKPDQAQDLYADIKKLSHETALQYLPTVQESMEQSADPLESALHIAAAGNIIDFGAKNRDSLDLDYEMKNLHVCQFGRYDLSPFLEKLDQTKQLLYLCDNVGEIVFDKLLMQQIRKKYPQIKIIAAMRHQPIINDATVEDAYATGLQEWATVMSSGSIYPGTILDECSPEFQTLYAQSDLILSKGQGNFETLLHQADERIFFLLRIKCQTMAQLANLSTNNLVFMQGKSGTISPPPTKDPS